VTIIDPGFALNDDHPPHHPGLGQQFIAAVYQALATSPLWQNILFVVTYDEHGGFFDHVAPPKTADDRAADGFDQLGFRVPTMVIGPYVKPGYVSSVQYDHTSSLKHIETMFDLEPLTARDAAASDLSDAIDAERLAAGDFAPPITLPVVELDAETIDPACKSDVGQPRHRRAEMRHRAYRGPRPDPPRRPAPALRAAFYIGDCPRVTVWEVSAGVADG
jgi:phospholipase C